jgi:hypothetical protein
MVKVTVADAIGIDLVLTGAGADGELLRGRRCGRLEALLVVALHVEAANLEKVSDAAHERFRAAAEDGALAKIRREQREAGGIDAAAQSVPAVARIVALDDEAERRGSASARQDIRAPP